MKKSVALLAVIIFLISILSLLSVILNRFSFFTNRNDGILITENSVIIKQTLKTLKNISENIKTSRDLKKIFVTFPIKNKSGNLNITFKITPLYNKIDINSYLKNNLVNNNTDEYIMNILNFYELSDPVFFKNLILDTIDTDTDEREGYSEIILQNPNFQNGKIYNFRHFKKILKYYFHKTKDKNIFKIPWKKLIFFGNGKKHILDCNILTSEVAGFLGLIFNGKVNCKNLFTEENNETLKKYDIIEYKKQTEFLIKVKINYVYNELNEKIVIIYDIYSKKVKSIESHPVY